MIVAWALSVACAIGCNQSSPPAKPAPPPAPRTVRLGEASLYIDGDNWLYSYPVGEQTCYVAGIGVAIASVGPERLVLNLDLTPTAWGEGAGTGNTSTVDVPLDGMHQFRCCVPQGWEECQVNVPENADAGQMLEAFKAAARLKKSR